MTKYVVGFLFSTHHRRVALIVKKQPLWQRGLLNGIGGKIETNERPHDAMVREFYEEAGALVCKWRLFCEIRCSHGWIYFFEARGRFSLSSKTSEKVGWYNINRLASLPVLGNLHWLIPLALDTRKPSGVLQQK